MSVPNFKIASAIIHFDETSPHMYIVGLPIKEKNGMELQVGKSNVFTKDSLKVLQDKMRTLCIEEFNKEYGLDNILKKKRKGRNNDFLVSEMDNYSEMQESNSALELRKTQLKEENNKLKSRNSSLENELKNLKEIFEIFKNKLERLYHFFVDKMWGDKEKQDKYYPVAYELYGKNILDEEQIRGILGTKQNLQK